MHAILFDLNQKSLNIAASAIISKDGLVMASILPEHIDEDRLGSIAAALFSAGCRGGQSFAGGAEQMMLKAECGYMLITHAGKEAFLAVITKTHAEIDQLISDLKCSAARVAENLSY